VARFGLGFLVASGLWAALGVALHLGFGWGPAPVVESAPVEVAAAAEEAVEEEAPSPRRRRGRARTEGARASDEGVPGGEATVGDDLREGEMRTIDGEGTGGEEQLSGAEVERAFDGVMGRIRRCFLLTPGEEPITGTLTFGLRVAGTGRVSAVNLSGPRALTSGEPGDCLRDVARGIAFPTFDGPEMVVRYPITLE
jgi:hypothetical protein